MEGDRSDPTTPDGDSPPVEGDSDRSSNPENSETSGPSDETSARRSETVTNNATQDVATVIAAIYYSTTNPEEQISRLESLQRLIPGEEAKRLIEAFINEASRRPRQAERPEQQQQRDQQQEAQRQQQEQQRVLDKLREEQAQAETARAMSYVDRALKLEKGPEEQIAYLQKNRHIFHEAAQEEINSRIAQLRDRQNAESGRQTQDNREDSGNNGQPPTEGEQEYDGGERPESNRETLDYLETEHMRLIRQYGEYYTKNNEYRTSTDRGANKGRFEEEFIQKEVARLLQKKQDRYSQLERRKRELKEASSELDSQDNEKKREYEKLRSDLVLNQDDRHQAEEQTVKDQNLPQLQETLQARQGEVITAPNGAEIKGDRETLKEALNYYKSSEVNHLDVEMAEAREKLERIQAGSLNETENNIQILQMKYKMAHSQKEKWENVLKEVDTRIKSQNAICHRIAQIRLEEGNEFEVFKKFEHKKEELEHIEAEIKRYKDRNTTGVRSEKDFSGMESFGLAMRNYQAYENINSKKEKEYKANVESYLQEAMYRGYFQEFQQEINKLLKPIMDKFLAAGRKDFSLEPHEADAIIAVINELLSNPDQKMRSSILERIKLGNMKGVFDKDGKVDLKESYPDLDQFDGVARHWLESAKEAIEQKRSGENRSPKFKGEFSFGERTNLWEATYMGYYEIYAQTPEEFEQVVNTFVQYLTSGAVERNPEALHRQLQYFEQNFTSKTNKLVTEGKMTGEEAAGLRHRAKAYVGFYSADYFASLADTDAYQAILKYSFTGLDAMDVMKEIMKTNNGQVGLALRLMDRDRRFLPIFRYHGENGGFALDSILKDENGNPISPGGDFEYLIRHRTELILAEELAIYDLKSSTGNVYSDYLSENKDRRKENLEDLVYLQSTDKFMGRFQLNERAKRIRDAIRNKQPLNKDDKEFWDSRIKEANQAVTFARYTQSALGERTLKAAPSYITEIKKRSDSGNFYDENGLEVNQSGQLLIEGTTMSRLEFMQRINELKNRYPQFAEAFEKIRQRELENKKLLDDWRKLKKGETLSPEDATKVTNIRSKLSQEKKGWSWRKLFRWVKQPEELTIRDDGAIEGIGFMLERTDYVSKDLAIKFMQFSENLARIMATEENKKRRERGDKLLTAFDIAKKAKAFRWHARDQIDKFGIGAKIVDETGNLIYFKGKLPSLKDFKENGGEIQQATFFKEQLGSVNLESAASVHSLVRQIVQERIKAGTLTKAAYNHDQSIQREIEQEAKAKLDRLINEEGYFNVDFDGASTHVISQWNAQAYIPLQHEIRSQILRPDIRKQAELIRQGLVSPEGEYEDENGDMKPVDILASWLLQIDPTLEKLQHIEHEEQLIALLTAAVEVSFQNHWRITRELDRQFLDPTDEFKRHYYGIPNERFSIKELMWNSNKVAREPQRFARRAWKLIAESPVHWSSLSDTMGVDISGMMGVFERSDWFGKDVRKEATDSNVLAGWIEDIAKAKEIYIRFAKSGKIGNQDVTSLMIKPFNDLDSAEKIQEFAKAMSDPSSEIAMYQAFRPLLERLEGLLKAIEAQDNSRSSKGALWIEYADIIYENGNAKVIFYDEKTGKPDTLKDKKIEGHVKEVSVDTGIPDVKIISDPRLRETGSGAHSAYTFYREFVKYANILGKSDYSGQAWAIWMMGKKTNRFDIFENFWDWFGTKAIRTYPE